MTKPTLGLPQPEQTSSVRDSGSGLDGLHRSEEEQLGVPFHRFQQLKQSNLGEATRCFADFKTGILRRIEWEEATLFPQFDEKIGVPVGDITASLRAEHGEIRAHLEAIELKLSLQNLATDSDEAALEALLSAHNHREHDAIYPVFEALKPEEQSL